MSIFSGTHESNLDMKKGGRVTLPRPFRVPLPKAGDAEEIKEVSLFSSPEKHYPTIFGCAQSALDILTQIQYQLDDHYEDGELIASDIIGTARQFRTEATGRLNLLQDFIDFAGLTDKAIFFGQGGYFEIWPEGGIEKYREARRTCVTRRILMRVAGMAAAGNARGISP
jgi:DNA-binding transcriptional regulator/RsmH inhibitor MraZ